MVLHRWRRFLHSQLWFRPALASVVSVLVALGALFAGRTFETKFNLDVSEESLITLFGIFASSMLSVATFTVSAIVSAASSAANSTTPRAAQFILSDSKAQLVLSAFIAAFIYSITGILALKAFHYGNAGRFLLFAGLIVIVVFVLISFINWVDHAMKLGRQGTTIASLTDIALQSLTEQSAGTFGAKVFEGAAPEASAAFTRAGFGYVAGLDLEPLQRAAEARNCFIALAVRPGEHVEPTRPVAFVTPAAALDDELRELILQALDVDAARGAPLDVRFNVVNLAETADRALSPAVNDPGTAINIMNELLRVLSRWAALRSSPAAEAVQFDRLAVPPLTAEELVTDAFTPIARDGAGVVEVGVRLQKVLSALKRLQLDELTAAARRMSDEALELSDEALQLDHHKERVRAAARD